MDAATPHVHPAQTLIVSSQYSLSAMYLREVLDRRGIEVPIVAWGTTVVMGRRVGRNEVAVLTVRAAVDVATLPDARSPTGLEKCRALFGDRFHPRANLIAIQLSNVNPQAHLANALCNLTRMEKGEAWDNYGGLTDSVSRLVESLDVERLAIAQAFGVKVRSMREHMSLSFDLASMPLADAAREVVSRGGSPGPSTLEARWILEDLPFGIVPQIALADIAGVEVPLHRAGLTLFSALLGRDLAAENDLLPHLPIANATPEHLTQLSS
jgi:opine dehydrogenase